MSRVSVIIPNYNRSGLVNETVRNVLAQSLAPHQVIVVDDGSTDDSVESLKSEFGDRIELIQQNNQGPGAARNAGLDKASGEFIWLMDSDDIASLNKLETQVEALKTSNADMVYGPWAQVHFNNAKVKLENVVLQQQSLPVGQNVLSWFVNDWSNVFQQFLIRRSSIGPMRFSTDLFCGEDGEFFVRMLLGGARVTFDNRSLLLYRLSSSNKLTGSDFECRKHRDWAKALLAISGHLETGHRLNEVASYGFRYRNLNAIRTLRNCPEDHVTLIQKLKKRVSDCPRRFLSDSADRTMRRISGGIKQRISGHRWHHCFRPGKITTQQVELIEQLGFKVEP